MGKRRLGSSFLSMSGIYGAVHRHTPDETDYGRSFGLCTNLEKTEEDDAKALLKITIHYGCVFRISQ